MEKVKIWIEDGAFLPKREHCNDAGLDLCVMESTCILPGRNLVKTGVHIAMPDHCTGDVRPRSGFSLKGFNNGVGKRFDADVLYGTVDPGYRGEIGVIVKSHEGFPFMVEKGTAIAQLVIIRGVANDDDIEVVDSYEDDSNRGEKGFGG